MYLPHDLIIQILLKLPVKSLIRFKCVCKSWFTLISDPHFSKTHFHLTPQQTNTRILFLTSTPEFRSLDLESHNAVSSLTNPNFSLPKSYSEIQIKGSCRGFILLQCCSNIYLWNPSTGVHIDLPSSPIVSSLDANFTYGFGYDQLTDDYLVVSVSFDHLILNRDRANRLGLFSLRDNKWKEIECTDPYRIYKTRCYIPRVESFVNGAIHWLAYCIDIGPHVIVGFNFTERKLIEFPLRFLHDFADFSDCELWIFRGCLSLWELVSQNNTVDIWVMEEYNVHSSWTKTLVLTIDDSFIYFNIIGSMENGDIIVADGDGLVKYNDKGEWIKHNSDCKYSCMFQLAMYTESLLSHPSEQV